MSLRLYKLRHIRQELEEFCHPTPLKKWVRRMKALRVAGAPYSVSLSERVEIATGMFLDRELPIGNRLQTYELRRQWMATRRYQERVMLDQEQLQRYLKAFRENDYRVPELSAYRNDLTTLDNSAGQQQMKIWVEDFSKRDQELIMTQAELDFEDQLAREAQELGKFLKSEYEKKMATAAANPGPRD